METKCGETGPVFSGPELCIWRCSAAGRAGGRTGLCSAGWPGLLCSQHTGVAASGGVLLRCCRVGSERVGNPYRRRSGGSAVGTEWQKNRVKSPARYGEYPAGSHNRTSNSGGRQTGAAAAAAGTGGSCIRPVGTAGAVRCEISEAAVSAGLL